MSEKVITLPNQEEMLQRLLGVSDHSDMQKRFYPILLKQAGQERGVYGIIMMLAFAIQEYTKGMAPAIARVMYAQVPDFVDALVDDPEVAEQAKTFLQEALASK